MSVASAVIREPARDTPVAWQGDLVVVGGSCTGVFAAVRAARLGLSVAIIEQGAIFGGSATAAQVNEWHSLYDTTGEQQIIGGLTAEVVSRLEARDAVNFSEDGLRSAFRFNSAELALVLDELVCDNNIRPFLQARLVNGIGEHGQVEAAVIEDKSGRRALQARAFIDASGDGDLLRHCGFTAWQPQQLQPVTLQALVHGFSPLDSDQPDAHFWHDTQALAKAHGLPDNNAKPWISHLPGVPGVSNLYGPRMHGVDASNADHLTNALLQGRRHVNAYRDMAHRRYPNAAVHLTAWSQALGVRETWHAHCLHRLQGEALMNGEAFDDAIGYGTYPVDIHHPQGTVIRSLDGTEQRVTSDGLRSTARWRDERHTPPCYQISYRSLVPKDSQNLLVAGRLIDAEPSAFGAVRVMVNCNQTGEAAGVAVALALKSDSPMASVDRRELREALVCGGSLTPAVATPGGCEVARIPR